MKTEVDQYRGWQIIFDTDKENFSAYSDHYDSEGSAKSYSAVKKYIDDYIKMNTDFKPFKVVRPPSIHNNLEILTVVGMRKDGRCNIESNGKIRQLSTYDEKSYFIYDKSHDEIFEKHKKLAEQIKLLQREANNYLEQNFKPKSLKEFLNPLRES